MYNLNSENMPDPQYQAAYAQAERRVKAKVGFYSHLASYVAVNGLLIVIYLTTGPLSGSYSYPWFIWPMFGWGIGLLFHFLGVFVFSNSNGAINRQKMIEEELRRMGVDMSSSTAARPVSGGWPHQPQSGTISPPSAYQVPPDKQS